MLRKVALRTVAVTGGGTHWLVKYGISMLSTPMLGPQNSLQWGRRGASSDSFHGVGKGSGE